MLGAKIAFTFKDIKLKADGVAMQVWLPCLMNIISAYYRVSQWPKTYVQRENYTWCLKMVFIGQSNTVLRGASLLAVRNLSLHPRARSRRVNHSSILGEIAYLVEYSVYLVTGDPLHSRALAHSRAPLFTQPCPHCSHSRAPGEQWARLCVIYVAGLCASCPAV